MAEIIAALKQLTLEWKELNAVVVHNFRQYEEVGN
jgi:hypothetical protein